MTTQAALKNQYMEFIFFTLYANITKVYEYIAQPLLKYIMFKS